MRLSVHGLVDLPHFHSWIFSSLNGMCQENDPTPELKGLCVAPYCLMFMLKYHFGKAINREVRI